MVNKIKYNKAKKKTLKEIQDKKKNRKSIRNDHQTIS